MRTIAGNSPGTVLCTLLLLLCGVVTSAAAEAVESGKEPAENSSMYSETVPNQSAPADQTIQLEASTLTPADSSRGLAELMSRIRTNVGTSHSDEEPGRPLALDVWSSHVKVPQARDEAEDQVALRSLIEQVRSVRFEDRTLAPTLTGPGEPQKTPVPPSETADTQPVKPEETPRILPGVPHGALPLSAKAETTLATLQQEPGRAKEPLAMAELLFLSGRIPEAIPFYEKALEQNRSDDPTSTADRAWILFQLGNCLRESDVAKAQQMYMELITKHPQSPWTELARAHGQLLSWQLQDRPRELVASRRP